MRLFSDSELSTGVRTLVYMLKTMYVMGLFLLGMWLYLTFVVDSHERISLRVFPYPYKAALAISNDIEGTDTPEEFLAIQTFISTDRETPWGKGLGLEAGSSFWFFDLSGQSQFTIFNHKLNVDTLLVIDSLSVPNTTLIDTFYNYSAELSINEEASKVIVDFIKAGYIDALNSYGPVDGYGFKREYAEKSVDFLAKNSISVPIWTNLQGSHSYQMLGKKHFQRGDNPEAAQYHSDLLKNMGVYYLNLGGYTSLIGQTTNDNIPNWFKKRYEFILSAWDATKEQSFDPSWNNRLLNFYKLDDEQIFLRFRRFIKDDGIVPPGGIDVSHISQQLKPETFDRLVEVGGYMILNTRLGSNSQYAEWIPESAREALKLLAERFRHNEILVSTPSRILDYYIVWQTIDWSWSRKGNAYIIEIKSQPQLSEYNFTITREKLQGLTFYTPSPEKTQIMFDGEAITPLQISMITQAGVRYPSLGNG